MEVVESPLVVGQRYFIEVRMTFQQKVWLIWRNRFIVKWQIWATCREMNGAKYFSVDEIGKWTGVGVVPSVGCTVSNVSGNYTVRGNHGQTSTVLELAGSGMLSANGKYFLPKCRAQMDITGKHYAEHSAGAMPVGWRCNTEVFNEKTFHWTVFLLQNLVDVLGGESFGVNPLMEAAA